MIMHLVSIYIKPFLAQLVFNEMRHHTNRTIKTLIQKTYAKVFQLILRNLQLLNQLRDRDS